MKLIGVVFMAIAFVVLVADVLLETDRKTLLKSTHSNEIGAQESAGALPLRRGGGTSAESTGASLSSADSDVDGTLISGQRIEIAHLHEGLVHSIRDESNQGVANAEVYLLPVRPSEASSLSEDGVFAAWEAQGTVFNSDDKGEFRLPQYDESIEQVLVVKKSGYAWHSEILEPGYLNNSIQVALSPSIPVTGWVLDREGRPITGAQVRAESWMPFGHFEKLDPVRALSHQLIGETTTSNRSGEFRLEQIPNTSLEFEVEARGSAPSVFVQVSPAEGLIFTLVDSCIVHGYVSNHRGEPIENVWVQSVAIGSLPESVSPFVKTDSSGYYHTKNGSSPNSGEATEKQDSEAFRGGDLTTALDPFRPVS